MARAFLLLLCILSVVAISTAQKHAPPTQIDVVGTWVADPASAPKGARPTGIELTLNRDGTLGIGGPNVRAAGTYKIVGKTIVFSLNKSKNAPPGQPQGGSGSFTIAENGKALLGDSGIRQKGKVVLMRLIRKKSGPRIAKT